MFWNLNREQNFVELLVDAIEAQSSSRLLFMLFYAKIYVNKLYFVCCYLTAMIFLSDEQRFFFFLTSGDEIVSCDSSVQCIETLFWYFSRSPQVESGLQNAQHWVAYLW